MADYRDELYRRRQEKRAKQKARLQRRRIMGRVLICLMALTLVVIGVMMLKQNGNTPSGQQPTVEQVTDASATQTTPAASDEPTTVIHVAAAGDLMVTDETVRSGISDNGYDYTSVFMDIAPVFSEADLALLNFEGNLLGAPYGTESTSAPVDLAKALKAAGVDLVQMANSTAITDGMAGLKKSLAGLRDAGLEPIGAFADAQEFQKYKGYTMVNVQGVRIAFVAFTKGMGGLSLPAGSEN